jgi:phospholipid/cholesterol/gamma-HCH transport system substrate-binding protein
MWVGVIVVALCVLLTYAAFEKRVPGTPRWTLKGQFSDSTQIRPGAPVRIAGIRIGQVIAVGRGPGTTALVTMAITNEGQPIHSDATLTLRPRLFLEGSPYVQLAPGSPSAPIVHSGFTVPLANTEVPVPFIKFLSTFNEPIRQAGATILAELTTGFEDGGALGFKQLFKQLPATFRNVAVASNAFQGEQPDDLSHLIKGFASVQSELAAHDQALGQLIDNFDRFAGALATQNTALAQTVSELDTTATITPLSLAVIDQSLPPTKRLFDELSPALKIAPPIINNTVRILNELGTLSQPNNLPALLTIVKALAIGTPVLSTELDYFFNLVTPVAACFNNTALPAAQSAVDDGQLSSGQPLWQDFLHAFVGLSSGGQNFTANGQYFRANGAVGPTQAIGSGASTVLQTGNLSGTRPAWNGPNGAPALRPDVSCTTQPQVNFAATTDPNANVSVVGP